MLSVQSTSDAAGAYALNPAGNRLAVQELSGRKLEYGYDDLYRLTSETITGATAQNGTIGYSYDPVGNRKQITSTLPQIPARLFNYDANDRLSTDSYDANGNTIVSNSITNTYDFENHLIKQQPNITLVYDGDGSRVAKTVAGLTTKYLVDDLNPTGFSQVIVETISSAQGEQRQYVYGLERISQRRTFTAAPAEVRYYSYDGHGSVRQLTDSIGNVIDSYTYDAFGNLIGKSGTTPNNYLFAGEQFDPDLGLYYNRARYLNTSTGRFWSMDTDEGRSSDPISLHK